MMLLSRYLLCGLVLLTITSCGLIKDSGAAYEKSTIDDPLELPKGLPELNRDEALTVPEE